MEKCDQQYWRRIWLRSGEFFPVFEITAGTEHDIFSFKVLNHFQQMCKIVFHGPLISIDFMLERNMYLPVSLYKKYKNETFLD